MIEAWNDMMLSKCKNFVGFFFWWIIPLRSRQNGVVQFIQPWGGRCGALHRSQQGVAWDVPVKLLLININDAMGLGHRMINLSYHKCITRVADSGKSGDKKKRDNSPLYLPHWRNKICNDSGYSGLLITKCLQCTASISTLRPLFPEPEISTKEVEQLRQRRKKTCQAFYFVPWAQRRKAQPSWVPMICSHKSLGRHCSDTQNWTFG